VKDGYLLIDKFKNDKKILQHFFWKEELFHQRHRLKLERVFKRYMEHFGWNRFLQQLPFDVTAISAEQFIQTWGFRMSEPFKSELRQTKMCFVRKGQQTSTYFVLLGDQPYWWIKRND
jgi:hypothetical protein